MSRKRTVRVASGQGFWGDELEASVRQVEGGPIDYRMLDYLAEVTMSILRKQKSKDPSAGYARDFVTLMERILATCVERRIRVVSNAGGVNPEGCAQALISWRSCTVVRSQVAAASRRRATSCSRARTPSSATRRSTSASCPPS